jgi:hypothetical protein
MVYSDTSLENNDDLLSSNSVGEPLSAISPVLQQDYTVRMAEPNLPSIFFFGLRQGTYRCPEARPSHYQELM